MDQFQQFPHSTDCHTKHIAMPLGLWPSRSKFAALYRQWWRLYMSKHFSSGTINLKQTKKKNLMRITKVHWLIFCSRFSNRWTIIVEQTIHRNNRKINNKFILKSTAWLLLFLVHLTTHSMSHVNSEVTSSWNILGGIKFRRKIFWSFEMSLNKWVIVIDHCIYKIEIYRVKLLCIELDGW